MPGAEEEESKWLDISGPLVGTTTTAACVGGMAVLGRSMFLISSRFEGASDGARSKVGRLRVEIFEGWAAALQEEAFDDPDCVGGARHRQFGSGWRV